MAHDHEQIVYGMNDVKELYDASVMTGTIISVYESDKADVDISGLGLRSSVPIFYHCPGEDTVYGGAVAFEEGDSVYVLNKKGRLNPSASDLQIVGFVDGPKSCGFRFKLTRGDETLITEDSGLLSYINLYNSDDEAISITEPIYTPVPATGEDTDGFWSFNILNSGDADPNGYWVDYSCEDGILTQYPYRYKDSEKEEYDDLIPIGVYEDIVPYWKVSTYSRFDGVLWNDGDPLPFVGYGCPGWSFLSTAKRISKVESSVEFRIHYVVDRLTALFQRYHTESGPYCERLAWKLGARSPDIPWLWGSKEAEATFSIVSTDGDGPLTLKVETLDVYHIHPSNVSSEAEYSLDLDVTGAPSPMPFDTGNTSCSPPLKGYTADYAATYINVLSDSFILVVIPQYDF